jgi:hypothetical protein
LLASGTNPFGALALDSTSVYFTTVTEDIDAGAVFKIALGGGAITTLGAGQRPALAVAVDNTNVYWTVATTSFADQGAVMTSPLAGGTPMTLVSSDEGLFGQGLAVDSTSVYFTSGTSVIRLPLGGGPSTTLAGCPCDPPNPVPSNIAVAGPIVYWTNSYAVSGDGPEAPFTGSVMMAPLDGGAPTIIASAQDFPVGIVADSTNIYWVNTGLCGEYGGSCSGSVMRLSLSGGAATTLASGQSLCAGLAVDSKNVYWGTADTNAVPPTGWVMAVPIAGGTATTLTSAQGPVQDIAVDSTSVYWTTGCSLELADGGTCDSGGSLMKFTPK